MFGDKIEIDFFKNIKMSEIETIKSITMKKASNDIATPPLIKKNQ